LHEATAYRQPNCGKSSQPANWDGALAHEIRRRTDSLLQSPTILQHAL
jgi:hypothetical protein